MLELWYYAEGEDTRGPISAVDLVALLSTIPDPRTVVIWRHGFEDWKRTDEVPEIARQVVRPPPRRPKASPPPVSVREPAFNDTDEFKDVKPVPDGLGGWLSRGAVRATSFAMVTVFFGFVGSFVGPALIEGVSLLKREDGRAPAESSAVSNDAHTAIAEGNETLVRQYLLAGMSANSTAAPFGMPVLHLAQATNHPRIVTLLIQHGARPNDKFGPSQRTALHDAALGGRIECMRALLSAGADPNSINKFGRPRLISPLKRLCH